MDAWTLCKIMGWSSLAVAMRYIHPSEQRVLEAFEPGPELCDTGDKSGDTDSTAAFGAGRELSVSIGTAAD